MQRHLAQKLPLVTRGWRQLADGVLAELRLSNSMAWCLIYIDRLGPEARQIDLAQEIGITQPSTVRVLDQLAAAGFVERAQNPDDKRANRLLITPAGRDLIGTIEERLQTLRDELFDAISDAELSVMLRVVNIVSDRIVERRG